MSSRMLAIVLLTFIGGCHCDPGHPIGDSGDSKPPSDSEPPEDSAPPVDTSTGHTGHTGDSAPAVHTGDSSPTHTGDSAGDTAPEDPGPDVPHEMPTDGAMCFDCHLCGGEDKGTLDVTHYICVDCHVGPNGSVPEELQDSCGCDAIDCDADPPVLGCNECHTDGKNDQLSADEMNETCTSGGCHQPGDVKKAELLPPEEVQAALVVGVADVGVGG